MHFCYAGLISEAISYLQEISLNQTTQTDFINNYMMNQTKLLLSLKEDMINNAFNFTEILGFFNNTEDIKEKEIKDDTETKNCSDNAISSVLLNEIVNLKNEKQELEINLTKSNKLFR